MEIKNIFIEGCSGSGKDTLANYFRDIHGYFKIRIADTIKRIICETENLTLDELEAQKRNNPELRLLHNEVGKYLDSKNGTVNRINQIINRVALDFQHIQNPESLKVCVCDARGYDNSEQLLKAGFLGFFLMRDPREFGNPEHWTEKTLARDKRIIELAEKYHKQMVVIFNLDRKIFLDELDSYRKNFIKENKEFIPALVNVHGNKFIEDFNTILKSNAFKHQVIDKYDNEIKKINLFTNNNGI